MNSSRILMGVIGRPHGVRGLVHVQSYTADPTDLALYAPLYDDQGRSWSLVWRGDGVAEVRDASGAPLADRSMAEKLVNTRLHVDRERLPTPDGEEFYLADLVGLAAHDAAGVLVGNVVEVHDYGAGTSLEIAREGKPAWTAQQRRDALIERITAMVAEWSLGPLVEALRGLRGIDLLSAATFIASTGDLSRFESPRLLMGYLGLVPSEHSSGGSIHRGGITKTGNREARRMLIEAAWSYQYPARVAQEKAEILVRLPKPIRDIAWKAQTRLCTRYRSMIARGKKPTVVVAAIARELAGFVWAIGQEMRLSMAS